MNKISTYVLYINGFDEEDFEFYPINEFDDENFFSDVYNFLNENEYEVRTEVVDNVMNFARILTIDS